jgi:hypothetical protein
MDEKQNKVQGGHFLLFRWRCRIVVRIIIVRIQALLHGQFPGPRTRNAARGLSLLRRNFILGRRDPGHVSASAAANLMPGLVVELNYLPPA